MLKGITEAWVIRSASPLAAPSSGKAFQHHHNFITSQVTEVGIEFPCPEYFLLLVNGVKVWFNVRQVLLSTK